MQRHIHIDPVGGVAGDMFVAAMLDAFPEQQTTCWNDVEAAGLLQHVSIELSAGKTQGLAAKRFYVTLRESPAKRTGRYADIKRWFEQSALSASVQCRALSILHIMALAEAQVHGVYVDDVHFHEIADWDSLVDVVAAASMIEHSGVDSWSCSALPLGSGMVNTEHGELPVPAPATLELLRGFPVWDDGDPGERVTPTGAAIVRHLFTGPNNKLVACDHRASGSVTTIGCGAGQRKLNTRPNMLRLVVTEQTIDPIPGADTLQDDILEITCDIDDMTPEEIAVSLEHVRVYTGVIDVSFQLAMGKKGRTFFHIVVMCQPAVEASVCHGIFFETTTLGMRVCLIRRRLLQRSVSVRADSTGSAGIKTVDRPGGTTAKVESDDLATQPGLQARRFRARQLLDQSGGAG